MSANVRASISPGMTGDSGNLSSSDAPRHARRLDWVDAAKGLGMILVVIGHVTALEASAAHNVIYWFHMPLFFFVGGMLLKRRGNTASLAARRVKRVMVPYLSFLVVLEAPKYLALAIDSSHRMRLLRELAMDFAMGGDRLRGPMTIFWFPPAMLVATLLGAWIVSEGPPRLLVGLCASLVTALAVATFPPSGAVPLGLGAVPFALSFVLLGSLFRELPEHARNRFTYAAVAVFLLLIALRLTSHLSLRVDLKYRILDPFWLALVGGLTGTLAAIFVAQGAVRLPGARQALTVIGRHSLALMYMHPPVIYALNWKLAGFIRSASPERGAGLVLVCVVIAILIPLGLQRTIAQWGWTRALFSAE